jgi:hypothetical protein
MPLNDLEELARIAFDWLWATDAEDRFSYVSSGAERVLGKVNISSCPRLGHSAQILHVPWWLK